MPLTTGPETYLFDKPPDETHPQVRFLSRSTREILTGLNLLIGLGIGMLGLVFMAELVYGITHALFFRTPRG